VEAFFFDVTEWQTVVFKGPTFVSALTDDDTTFACMLLIYLLVTGKDLNTFEGEDLSLVVKERLIWWHTKQEVRNHGVEPFFPLPAPLIAALLSYLSSAFFALLSSTPTKYFGTES
jgi:hypothetical protein